jgi:hypothetical protein
VRRDRTPNAAADRGERESGSLQSQFDARMPCGNRRHSLADRQLHRKRKISGFHRHLYKVEPGIRGQRQSAARRFATLKSRPHRTDQKGDGTKTEAEGIKNRDRHRALRSCLAKYFRSDLANGEIVCKGREKGYNTLNKK